MAVRVQVRSVVDEQEPVALLTSEARSAREAG